MPINDMYTLPQRVRTMREMADLLQAEQAEIEVLQKTAQTLVAELHMHSSKYLLDRYEKMFALPVNSQMDSEERQARLIGKLNARQMTTVRMIKALSILIIGYDAEIEEQYALYSFIIRIRIPAAHDNPHLRAFIEHVEEIKPAHLGFGLVGIFDGMIVNTYEQLAIERFRMLCRQNNFDQEAVYLDGCKNLDGTWLLIPNYDKNPLKSVEMQIHNQYSQIVNINLTEDTMYILDGVYRLCGSRALNAQIKRSEIV